jgi:ABC-type phosphate/phosphonate transport system substrate-binding protein
MTIAGLTMYDLPPLEAATDAWWSGLARAFRHEGLEDLPGRLTRGLTEHDLWSRPDLIFGQTCGYPLMKSFRDRLKVVATPVYAAPGCEGAHYRSWVVVRDASAITQVAELRGTRLAYNSTDSQSGYNALRALLAPLAINGHFVSAAIETGGHRRSIAAIREDRADFAAIDCVSYALVMRHQPELPYGTRIIAATPQAPSLPYITAKETTEDDLARLRNGLKEALIEPDLAWAREALLIAGAEILAEDAYEIVLTQEREAQAQGYGQLV